jgi:DNA-binding MarR family transcriptional regulator
VTAAPAADPIEAALVSLANDLVGRIWGHFTARAAELNLSITDAKALQNLEPGQAMPMRALAARLHSNPSNVTVVVARLEARNLLERQVGDDRRVKGVRLTPAGEALKHKLEARLIADHPIVRGLSPADQQNLLAILRQLS